MENLEPQQLIESSMLFRNLQAGETAMILAHLHIAHYKQGDRILERGTWHGRLHIIASGLVSVDVSPQVAESTGDGRNELRPYIVARLGSGECFGEMSLITGEPPTATIRAERDTTLWSLSQTDFLTLIGACPTLLQNINTILSRRLARTNEQVFSKQTAELVWLGLSDAHTTPVERSLLFSLADALAACSRKRVLLLELCTQEQALFQHFTTAANQVRPSLFECMQERGKLQAHYAPTAADNQPYAALAALAATVEQVQADDADLLSTLADVAIAYDYLLLAPTRTTPEGVIRAMVKQCQRAMLFVRATEAAPIASLWPFFEQRAWLEHKPAPSVFITRVPERLTVGAQDRYAAQVGRAVTRLLPAHTSLLERCWEQRVPLRRAAPGDPLTHAVDFVARHIARQTVGVAFGGGSARGFAHLGVLEQLLQLGVPIDYMSACSSGIIAPGMYLIGKSFHESEEIFLEIQRHLVQWRLPRTSLFSNKGLKHILHRVCGELRFEDMTTPFALVAVDLATRAGVVLDRGLLWQAALASTAIPGIFPPVLVGKHILMDAGIHDPVPIRLLRKMGADILVASELGEQDPPMLQSATPWLEEAADPYLKRAPSPNIVDVLMRSYDLAMATIGMHSIREADIVIRPKLHRVSLRQFSEGRKFIAAGREAVQQALPALKDRLPWL